MQIDEVQSLLSRKGWDVLHVGIAGHANSYGYTDVEAVVDHNGQHVRARAMAYKGAGSSYIAAELDVEIGYSIRGLAQASSGGGGAGGT